MLSTSFEQQASFSAGCRVRVWRCLKLRHPKPALPWNIVPRGQVRWCRARDDVSRVSWIFCHVRFIVLVMVIVTVLGRRDEERCEPPPLPHLHPEIMFVIMLVLIVLPPCVVGRDFRKTHDPLHMGTGGATHTKSTLHSARPAWLCQLIPVTVEINHASGTGELCDGDCATFSGHQVGPRGVAPLGWHASTSSVFIVRDVYEERTAPPEVCVRFTGARRLESKDRFQGAERTHRTT